MKSPNSSIEHIKLNVTNTTNVDNSLVNLSIPFHYPALFILK